MERLAIAFIIMGLIGCAASTREPTYFIGWHDRETVGERVNRCGGLLTGCR